MVKKQKEDDGWVPVSWPALIFCILLFAFIARLGWDIAGFVLMLIVRVFS